MKVLETDVGYYLVTGNLATYRRRISKIELEQSVDPYFVKYEVWNRLIEIEGNKLDGYKYLGYEEDEGELFVTQTAFWATSYNYVRKDAE